MFAFIKKCVVLLGIAVLIISSTASATEFICYDFDNSEGTLNAVGLQRNAENATVQILRENGNAFGHLYVPNVTEGKTPYVILRQSLNDKSFSIENGKAYVFSMDIKTDAVAAGNLFYLFNWDYLNDWGKGFIAFSCSEGENGMMNVNFFDQKTNQTVGTHSVKKDEYFNVMSVLDGTTKSFVYYCNGEKVNSVPVAMFDLTIDYIYQFGFRYHGSLNSGDANVYYDNIKVEKIENFGIEKTSIPENGEVGCDVEKFSLVFNEKIDAESAENIKILNESGEEIELETQPGDDGKTVNITLSESLRANSSYKISTVGVKHWIAEMVSEEEISFNTKDGLNITKPVLRNSEGEILDSLAKGELSAQIYVDNELYEGNISGVKLIMAYYKDKKLIRAKGASLETITDHAQSLSVSMTIEENSQEYYVKLFVIDNYNEMFPVKAGVKIPGV